MSRVAFSAILTFVVELSHIYIYIYIYRERERERDRGGFIQQHPMYRNKGMHSKPQIMWVPYIKKIINDLLMSPLNHQ